MFNDVWACGGFEASLTDRSEPSWRPHGGAEGRLVLLGYSQWESAHPDEIECLGCPNQCDHDRSDGVNCILDTCVDTLAASPSSACDDDPDVNAVADSLAHDYLTLKQRHAPSPIGAACDRAVIIEL